jgi:hypothetical protein
MTTVADLPPEAKVIPASWSFNMEPESREHVLTWKVPFAQFNTFWQKTLYTAQAISIAGIPVSRVFPLVCPMDPSLIALTLRPGGPPQGNQRGETHPDGPWEETSTGSGIYRPRTSPSPWKLVYPTVTFGIPKYPTTGDQAFMEVTEEDRIDRRTVPNYPYELIDNTGAHVEWVAQDIALPAGTSLFRLTWHQLADLPAAQAVFNPILDCVNDAPVTMPIVGGLYDTGTLHCSGKSSSVSIGFGGNFKATLSVSIAHFPGGWNRVVASAASHAGELLRINPRPLREVPFGPMFTPAV